MEAALVVWRKLTEFAEEVFNTARASGKPVAIMRHGDGRQELET
jgi:hypothetical protein